MSLPRILAAMAVLVCAGTIPSQVVPFGQGCGTDRAMRLQARTPAVIGGILDLYAYDMPRPASAAGFVGWYLFGSSDRFGPFGALPTDLGSLFPGNGGCELYVSTDGGLAGPLILSGGAHALPLPVPNDSRLVGVDVYTQVLIVDPAFASLRLYTSNALRITIR
jgi:hypothetical protein